MAVSAEALRLAWGVLAWVGLAGCAWTLWIWTRAVYWSRAAQREHWSPADQQAQDARRLAATYRVGVKLAFTGYALFRWDILSDAIPSVLDWRQAGDVALFGTGLVLLTGWSLHTYWAMQREVRQAGEE